MTDHQKVSSATSLPDIPVANVPPLPPPVGASRPMQPPPPAPHGSPTTGSTTLGSGKSSGGGGKGLVGIGLLIGLVVVSAIIGLGAVTVNFFGGLTLVNNLATGDCVAEFFPSDETGYSEVYFVKTTACETPHAMEVYATSETLWLTEEYPGVDQAFVVGDEFCLREFDFFTGQPYEISPYEMWVFVPIPESWAGGDRTVQCLIGSYDEETLVEGTLRGSAVLGNA